MRGHQLFLAAVRRCPESIHQSNLLTHGLPKRFGSIGLDPLPVNLRLAGAASVQAPANLAVDPVTRKNCRDHLAKGPASRHRLQMANICLRNRTLWHRIQLFTRQSETLSETCVEISLHLDRAQCMAAKQFQRFKIGRLGSAVTEDLSEVEQVHIILQDKIGKTIHRQGPGVQLTEERMTVDRSPNSLSATS